MSVSKLCSTITGLYSGEHDINDEKYTASYLKGVMKELDKAVGYSKLGGRTENDFPEMPVLRKAAYDKMGKIRKAPDFKVPTGELSMSVIDAFSDPLVAEIRLYPIDEKSQAGVTHGYTADREVVPAQEIADKIYGAAYEAAKELSPDYIWFDYFRRTTDDNGTFNGQLPCGLYHYIVDKGSEYEIAEGDVEIPGELTVTLRRLVDLTREGWYVGDLHHHSIFSSPAYPPQGTDFVYDTPSIVQNSMRAKGLTFGALSDHHNTLNHREWEKLITDDFLPILSKEISTSNGHVLQLNTDPDVIYHIPPEPLRTDEVMRKEFLRVTDEIKSYGGHPQINHPRDMQKAISFPPQFTDIVDIFNTMEIWNGSHPLAEGCTNGNAMKLWLDCLENGVFLGATTGSDTHEVTCEFWFDSFAYVFGVYLAVKAAVDNTEGPCNKDGVILKGEILEKAKYFLELLSVELPVLKKWGMLNISSGCVRTYVNAPGERTPKNLLEHLRKGDSFLTNGPVITGVLTGNDAHLRIISNRPLKKLFVLSDGYNTEEFELSEAASLNGGFDYSCTVNLNVEGKKWFVFRVLGEDVTTEAITNPFFI